MAVAKRKGIIVFSCLMLAGEVYAYGVSMSMWMWLWRGRGEFMESMFVGCWMFGLVGSGKW